MGSQQKGALLNQGVFQVESNYADSHFEALIKSYEGAGSETKKTDNSSECCHKCRFTVHDESVGGNNEALIPTRADLF